MAAIASAISLAASVAGASAATSTPAFRPPAVPLVTSDPYLSIWSEADHLNDDVTRHWTHHDNALVSLIRIDGTSYRLMGNFPSDLPPFPQTKLTVLPTRSIYEFSNGHVHVTMTFLSPALPDDLNVLTRPLSYITWDVRSIDGKKHDVSIYDSASSQLAVNSTDQKVQWGREKVGPLTALRVGTQNQTLLTPAGDDTRIDWGYAYTATNASQSKSAIGDNLALITSFIGTGSLPAHDDTRMPRAASDDQPVLAFAFPLHGVGAQTVSRHVMIAYDEIYAVKFFGKNLRPYWRRNGATAEDLLREAERDYASLNARCQVFDQKMMADLKTAGGPDYADLGALAYRQCLAGTGIAADSNKQPLLFTKENTSNGDIATVDVIFPMDPMLLLISPTMAKASIVPVLEYGASARWRFPNAPHDLGTYPNAHGTDDGGEQMPVEESGNILLICDAIAHAEGNAHFTDHWWPTLSRWAQYLIQFGNDPNEQLCTDDFMGHLAHNSNLSIKGILALAAYGDLCRMRGDMVRAKHFNALAHQDADHWVRVAEENGHSRLAFDKPGTWSQKYNLVWDRILGLNVFPPSVASQEITYYKHALMPFGLPLDSRTTTTKSDWTVWSATLAQNPADFRTLIAPMHTYLNQTTSRSPYMDSYNSNDVHSDGMHARPVIGGVFVRMLADPVIWKRWATNGNTPVGNWAPLPPKPTVTTIVPTSEKKPITWTYTTDKPADGWMKPDFDASSWKTGPGGFGTAGTPGAVVKTVWNTGDIYLRRTFTMPAGSLSNLQFYVYHDDDIEVYVNGVLAAGDSGYVTSYQPMAIYPQALALLKPGAKITLAVHCHQVYGGQGVDVGLSNVYQP